MSMKSVSLKYFPCLYLNHFSLPQPRTNAEKQLVENFVSYRLHLAEASRVPVGRVGNCKMTAFHVKDVRIFVKYVVFGSFSSLSWLIPPIS